jgi:hypothetical protein
MVKRGITDPDRLLRMFGEANINESTPSGILYNKKPSAEFIDETLNGPKGAFQRAVEGVKKPVGMFNRLSARFPYATNVLSGLNAAESADLAKERFEKGQYGGAALAGLNTLSSGAAALPLSFDPRLDLAKGLGGVGEMIGIPAELAYEYFNQDEPKTSGSVVKKYVEEHAPKKAKGGTVITPGIPLSLKHVFYHRLSKGHIKS